MIIFLQKMEFFAPNYILLVFAKIGSQHWLLRTTPNFFRRKLLQAYLFNGCLSGSNHAERVNFVHAAMVGGLDGVKVPQAIESMRTFNQASLQLIHQKNLI
jgi:hypothetical protein